VGHSGCGTSASSSALPNFNLTTGVGTAAGKVSAASCGSTNGTVGESIDLELGDLPIDPTTGAHNFSSTWSLHYTVKLAATAGKKGQMALAEVVGYASTFIEDETNDTTFFSAVSPFLVKEITTSTYSHTVSKEKTTSWVDAHLKASHTYLFVVELEFSIVVTACITKCTASASLAMATGADGATLESVTYK
jgi:hypothetical protein